ncbi:MAG: DUF512 domain-containing protein [Fibrobacterota bacterium]
MNHQNTTGLPLEGLKIRNISRDSFLYDSGLRSADRILSVNGQQVTDELDFYFFSSQQFLEIELERRGRVGVIELERPLGSPLEVDFHDMPINRCTNRCVFCFIDQMPPGLRSSLYIKDEDLKHSFLNGNYVTLSSATKLDLERIVSIGLSPLFISVHATDPNIRAAMLRNRRAPDIRKQLRFLEENGISFHTQFVVCPGYNDGAVLEKSVEDLFSYGQSLLSIAVVPVGLTRFRKEPLDAVDRQKASEVCEQMGTISDRMAQKNGGRKLFLADEFFIRAGLPIPPASYYEDYPQIENGVGLVRQLLDSAKSLKRKLYRSAPVFRKKRSTVLIVTGQSAYTYIKKVVENVDRYVSCDYQVVSVENRFFGNSVTVTGLLAAIDVIRCVKKKSAQFSVSEVILPAVMFNYAGYTLDGYSPQRISRQIKLPVRVSATMEEVFCGE